MIASNEPMPQQNSYAFRGVHMDHRADDPEGWLGTIVNEAIRLSEFWQVRTTLDPETQLEILVDTYRLMARSEVCERPKEYLFWVLTGWLHFKAYMGPDAPLDQQDYLGKLWNRRDAIFKEHRWPGKDDNGDPWTPKDHLDELPTDYVAWSEEFSAAIEHMNRLAFRKVCEKSGVPEIAELKETDPVEFRRRCKIGSGLSEVYGRLGN
jgi:hypothetical protein